MNNPEFELRSKVIKEVREYVRKVLLADDNKGNNKISYGGRIFDEDEVVNLVNASLDFWLTAGRYSSEFEREFSRYLKVKHCSLTNSGSSANLLAFMALTSEKLGERRIKPGDEVITVAAGFPTTVSPLVQYGAIPVFLDIEIPSYNIDCSRLEEAVSEKTKAVFLAHTLGNPFDVQSVKDFCKKNKLWMIEDNCDALGARVFVDGEWKLTGTIGHLGTSSFYASHHITMGEGGAVYTNDDLLKAYVESFRDWGRDCHCPPGKDNCCGERFEKQLGELPLGYDHKYTFSHFGYNLKITDLQSAIGCAQLKKLDSFVEKRRENWKLLRELLGDLQDELILPEAEPNSEPSWFGFLITVRKNSGFTREMIVSHLEKNNIQTRMLFAGNLTMHPCFDRMRKDRKGFRVVGELRNTNRVMTDTFWVGIYPGLNAEMISDISGAIHDVIKR